MSYNFIVILSVTICGIISLVSSYYLSLVILDENSGLFKIVWLLLAIGFLTTFYAPIKHILIKYMSIDKIEGEDKDD